MEHKFLNEIDAHLMDYYTKDSEDYPEEKHQKWAEQREIYGFDSRDCWNLDETILMLAYERLCLFWEDSVEFISYDDPYNRFEFNGDKLNFGQALSMLIGFGRIALDRRKDFDDQFRDKMKKNFWDLWAIVHPALWW